MSIERLDSRIPMIFAAHVEYVNAEPGSKAEGAAKRRRDSLLKVLPARQRVLLLVATSAVASLVEP